MLTRDQILNAPDLKIAFVDVPEWGGTATIRVMSGLARDRFEAGLAKEPGNNLRARLVALCLCDEAGKLLFSEADLVALGEKSAPALHRVFEAAIKLNAIGKDGVDEAEKNSASAT